MKLQLLSAIFNEWAKRYAAAPEEFSSVLNAEGQPVTDYGDMCAIYFEKLRSELDPE